jgi:hypothetical protein
MGIRSRLTLLMLTGLLGTTPPSRPPGFNGNPVEPAACPTCCTTSMKKSGNRYWCRICEIWFTPRKTAGPGES